MENNKEVYPDLKKLLEFIIDPNKSINNLEEIFTINLAEFTPHELTDLPEASREHERAHHDEWTKYGIKAYYVVIDGFPAVIPDIKSLLKYITDLKITKEDFREIYLSVVAAPEKRGIKLGNTDLWMKRILKLEFKTLTDFALAYGASLREFAHN